MDQAGRRPGARGDVLSWLVVAVLAVAILLPMGYLVWGAFRSGVPGTPGAHYTADNVTGMLGSDSFWRALANTLLLSSVVASAVTVAGAAMAVSFVRIRPYGASLLRLGLVAPIFISPFVAAVAWITLYMPDAGLVNAALLRMGLPQFDLFSVTGTAVLMSVVFLPYGFLLLSDAVGRTSEELEDAARLCGASGVTVLRRITLPILTPALVSVFTITFVLSAEMFSIPSVLATRARFFTLSYRIYFETVRYPVNLPGAAAAGLVLTALSVLGLCVHLRMTRLHTRFVTVGGKASGGQGQPASAAVRAALTALIACYSLLTLVLPVAALVLRTLMPYFSGTIQWSRLGFGTYRSVLAAPASLAALRNSLILGVGAVLVCVTLAGFVGYVTIRRSDPASRLMNVLANIPLGVPGTVFGTALIWAFIGTPVYGTLAIVALAIYASWLPITVRTVQTAVIQIAPELGDAADVAGASPLQKARLVILPLLRSGLATSATVAFIISFNEVSASALLVTGRTATVPTRVFAYMFDGEFASASVFAVVQIAALSVLVLALSGLFSAAGGRTRARNRTRKVGA